MLSLNNKIEPLEFSEEITTKDGSLLTLRAVSPSDREIYKEFFNSTSRASRYYRFFEAKNLLSENELEALITPNFQNTGILIATTKEVPSSIAATAQYSITPLDSSSAEIHLLITDSYQKLGVGSQLLHYLAKLARQNGVQSFRATVMDSNTDMIQMIERSGFLFSKELQAGVFEYSFPIEETENYQIIRNHHHSLARKQRVIKLARVPGRKVAKALAHGRFQPVWRLLQGEDWKEAPERLLKWVKGSRFFR